MQEVQKGQMNLVKIAEVHGIKSKIVQRQQEILSRSLLFRIAAIASLISNIWSKTPGIDEKTITKDTTIEEKLLLVDFLLVSLKSGYKPNPVRRVMFPKSNREMYPLGIPTIKDRALQNLINLVLLPLVEMNSDLHSYGFRPYRSPKNAVGTLRAQLKSRMENEKK